jgi:hypothetical protein
MIWRCAAHRAQQRCTWRGALNALFGGCTACVNNKCMHATCVERLQCVVWSCDRVRTKCKDDTCDAPLLKQAPMRAVECNMYRVSCSAEQAIKYPIASYALTLATTMCMQVPGRAVVPGRAAEAAMAVLVDMTTMTAMLNTALMHAAIDWGLQQSSYGALQASLLAIDTLVITTSACTSNPLLEWADLDQFGSNGRRHRPSPATPASTHTRCRAHALH